MVSGSSIRRRRPSSTLAEQLGEVLVAARGDRTRQALADAAGVVSNTLGDLEKGRANPTLAYLEQIGRVYGLHFSIVNGGAAVGLIVAASEAEQAARTREAST